MSDAPRRSLRILVVDDDDADAMMIDEALTAAASTATVDRVADGEQALQYLRHGDGYPQSGRPDLILLDLNMPRMDGRATLAEIKSDDALKMIPVVILTTSAAEADVMSSYQHRANAYVTKPMDLDAFEAVVRQIDQFYAQTAVLPD
jgi:CheY-like chemotaxis protein